MPPTATAPAPGARANPAARKWTPEELRNRQRAAIKALETAAGANQAEDARRAVIATLTDLSDSIEDLAREADQAAAHAVTIEALREEQRAATKHLEGLTETLVAQRNKGGRNANLRHFEDEKEAADFALRNIAAQAGFMNEMKASGEKNIRAVYDAACRALTGESGSGDQFVHKDFYDQLAGSVQKYTNVFQHCRVIPMATESLEFRRRGSRARAYHLARATAGTGSDVGNPSAVTLKAEEFGCLSYMHRALLADQKYMPALGDLLMEDFSDGIARLLELDVTRGVKAGAVGSIMEYDPGAWVMDGFLPHALIPTQVLKSGATYASFTFDDALAGIRALPTRYFAFSPAFHFHRSMLYNFMGMKDAQGRYVWVPPTNGEPGTIWGYPYHLWEGMPTTGDSGSQAAKAFASFGVMSQAYVIGNRQSVEMTSSEHIKFAERQVGFLAVARYAGDVWDPNALVNFKTTA